MIYISILHMMQGQHKPKRVSIRLDCVDANLLALLKRPCAGKGKRRLSRNGLGLVALRGKRSYAHKADTHDARASAPERKGRYKPDADGKNFIPTPTLSPSSIPF